MASIHLDALELGGAIDLTNTALSLVLFLLGLGCMLTRRNVIKQVIGLRIMLQGASLGIIQAGVLHRDLDLAQSLVVSSLIAEAVCIAVALALIVNVYRHYPSGDIDDMDRLKG